VGSRCAQYTPKQIPCLRVRATIVAERGCGASPMNSD
jgi:hypothetical protein